MVSEPMGHHLYFSNVVVPELFFSNPEGFLDLLSNGGDRYLVFLWERAGESEGINKSPDREGLTVKVGVLDQDHRLGFVNMPPVEYPDECQFLGLLSRRSKITLKGVQRGESRVFVLVKGFGTTSASRPWVVGEILRTGDRRIFDTLIASPDAGHFKSVIRAVMQTND